MVIEYISTNAYFENFLHKCNIISNLFSWWWWSWLSATSYTLELLSICVRLFSIQIRVHWATEYFNTPWIIFQMLSTKYDLWCVVHFHLETWQNTFHPDFYESNAWATCCEPLLFTPLAAFVWHRAKFFEYRYILYTE